MLGILTQINATWMKIKGEKKKKRVKQVRTKRKVDNYMVSPCTLRMKLMEPLVIILKLVFINITLSVPQETCHSEP